MNISEVFHWVLFFRSLFFWFFFYSWSFFPVVFGSRGFTWLFLCTFNCKTTTNYNNKPRMKIENNVINITRDAFFAPTPVRLWVFPFVGFNPLSCFFFNSAIASNTDFDGTDFFPRRKQNQIFPKFSVSHPSLRFFLSIFFSLSPR